MAKLSSLFAMASFVPHTEILRSSSAVARIFSRQDSNGLERVRAGAASLAHDPQPVFES